MLSSPSYRYIFGFLHDKLYTAELLSISYILVEYYWYISMASAIAFVKGRGFKL